MSSRADPVPPESDPGSFEEFYTATAVYTVAVASGLTGGDEHLAREVTQEAYVVMVQKWALRDGLSLDDNRRYVLGIVRNKLRDWWRGQRRCEPLDREFDDPVDEPGFAEVVDELSLLCEVRTLIAHQPPRRRLVAEMFFLEEASEREIAVALSIAPSTVRTHIERLRKLLRPHVNQHIRLDRGGEKP